MRTYVGSLVHETNSFSPVPTRSADYGYGVIGYEDLLTACAHEKIKLIRGMSARAAPSAPTDKADYEALRDQMLDEVQSAGHLDCILLALHGAQVAEGYADCEGDVVARLRELVGPNVIIGVLLDLHASISEGLLSQADLVLAIKKYPHTDFPATGLHQQPKDLRRKSTYSIRPQPRPHQ